MSTFAISRTLMKTDYQMLAWSKKPTCPLCFLIIEDEVLNICRAWSDLWCSHPYMFTHVWTSIIWVSSKQVVFVESGCNNLLKTGPFVLFGFHFMLLSVQWPQSSGVCKLPPQYLQRLFVQQLNISIHVLSLFIPGDKLQAICLLLVFSAALVLVVAALVWALTTK